MNPQALDAFAAFVGLDWADATHAICLQVAGATRRELLHLAHRPAVSDAWLQSLRTRCNGHPVAVCLARKKGPIGSALPPSDCLVLFPGKPLTVAQYREALTPSRAQDAPTDADLQVARLRNHRDKLTPLVPQSPEMRAFAPLVEHRRRLVGDNVRLTHRVTRALNTYFPHVLQWLQEKDTALFGDFLSRWPTLQAVQRTRRPTLEHVFRAHNGRSADVIPTRLEAIKNARALTTDDGIIPPNVLLGHALVAPLRVTLQAMAAFATAIAQRAHAHPDFPFFDPLPGAGAVWAPRLLVAFGEQRDR